MKLSNDFSFFGLNTKAIRSYLKEQAKNQRGVRVTRRGDLVYVITSYAAFKLDVVLYSDVIQPVTLRECPTEGETIISGQCGFETEENAPDLVDLFKRHAPNEKPVERTPFLQDIQKQCVSSFFSTASPMMKPERFSSGTVSNGPRRRELGSASSTTMASMPLTASWRFWTASSKTDALTGLHRKAAPSQPARATPAASPGIYIPRPANLKTRIPTGTSKCTSLWRYLHETQGNPHS